MDDYYADVHATYRKVIGEKHAEISDLRAQLSRMIDPRALLRWEVTGHGANLCLGPFKVGVANIASTSPTEWYARRLNADNHSYHPNEAEARAAVERAVLAALGLTDTEE